MKLFSLKERNTTVRRELLGAGATFMTMAYIIFVNPAILQVAGLPFKETAALTCLGAGILTILMGIVTNYPFALASGMGLNAFLAYTVCQSLGYSWQVGMAVIFIEGVIITILVLTRLREKIMSGIPLSLKKAISVGIGVFIAFIGFQQANIVIDHPATLISMSQFNKPEILVSLIGLVIILLLMSLRVTGAILIGMLITALLAIPFGITKFPEKLFEIPSFATAGGFIFGLKEAIEPALWAVIFAFLISDFFDTMGTVIGVGSQGGFLDKEGRLPRLRGTLLVDSLGAVFGGALSVSSITTYIESAAGVAVGSRTGLCSVFVGLFFLVFMFLTPLAEMIGKGPITAPALIIVGFLMATVIKDIPWDKFDEALPAFLTIIMMPFSYSIAHGIGWGFISYTLIKIFSGKIKELSWMMVVSAVLFAISFSPIVPK